MNKTLLLTGLGIVIIASIVIFLARGSTDMQTGTQQNPSKKTAPQVTNSAMLGSKGSFEVETSEPKYYENVKGFFAKPKGEEKFPGVVMVHEWWGLNNNIKDMASQLASDGYVVLAVDLYGGNVAKTPDEARKYTSSLDQKKAIANMKAAVSYIQKQGASKIASLGWCFGGGQSLQLALSGQPLDATIIYYGTLETNSSKLSKIQWPVLGIFGDQDQSIKVDTVKQFDSALDSLKIENEIYMYPGVGHAFANPSGQNYAPKETKDAWEKTLDFLEKHLKS